LKIFGKKSDSLKKTVLFILERNRWAKSINI
jgi:hypothetical protein